MMPYTKIRMYIYLNIVNDMIYKYQKTPNSYFLKYVYIPSILLKSYTVNAIIETNVSTE